MADMLSSTQEAAELVVEESQHLELSQRDSDTLVQALLNPPAPNDRLQETMARYRQTMCL